MDEESVRNITEDESSGQPGVENRSRHPKFKTKLLFDIRDDQVPIIYSPEYDIKFFGIEKLHPFDVTKWGRAHQVKFKCVARGFNRMGKTA